MVEEQRTNAMTSSQAFDNRFKVNTTVSSDGIAAPDGTLTADKLNESSANGQHIIKRNGVLSAGTHTSSFFVKAAEKRYVSVYPQTGGSAYAKFDLVDGVIISTGGVDYIDSGIEAYADGWYRAYVVVNSSTNDTWASLYIDNDGSTSPAQSYQ